jgi:hypothetical protein
MIKGKKLGFQQNSFTCKGMVLSHTKSQQDCLTNSLKTVLVEILKGIEKPKTLQVIYGKKMLKIL